MDIDFINKPQKTLVGLALVAAMICSVNVLNSRADVIDEPFMEARVVKAVDIDARNVNVREIQKSETDEIVGNANSFCNSIWDILG